MNRNVALNDRMESAWTFAWTELFCEKTGLFYDWLSTRDRAHRFDHLPPPDEIRRQYPNPCGWGTGMEDSMLNAGTMMDVLCDRWKRTRSPELPVLAGKILDGMARCSLRPGPMHGFVVRSVSMADGESCYFNSSMDQFTWFIYGAWRYREAFGASDPVRYARAGELILAVAEYCRRTLSEKDGLNLHRLDGKFGLVSSFNGYPMQHKTMRLPMFYAAANAVSGGAWESEYRESVRIGLDRMEIPEPGRWWWDIEFSQMLISILPVLALDGDASVRTRLLAGLRANAERTAADLELKLREADDFRGEWSVCNRDWHLNAMGTREECVKDPSLGGGYEYGMPYHPKEYSVPNGLLRAIGNDVMVLARTPDCPLRPEWIDGFVRTALRPDWSRAGMEGVFNLLHAYESLRSSGAF